MYWNTHMKKTNLLFSIIALLSTQIILPMNVARTYPNEEILAKLKPIPQQQSITPNSVPNIENYQQPNRQFIAKMDSFGLIRYFALKNNQDAAAIIQAARNGGGWDPEFFYYDEDSSSILITTSNNITIISDY